MVIEPTITKLDDADLFEGEETRSVARDLAVDLRGQTLGRMAIMADAWAAPLALLVVAEVPDLAPQVPFDLADPKCR